MSTSQGHEAVARETCGARLIMISWSPTSSIPGGHRVLYVCSRDPHGDAMHEHAISDTAIIKWTTE